MYNSNVVHIAIKGICTHCAVSQDGPQCMILCVTHKSPLENGPFIQQVHPNKRQEASSQSAARIQDSWGSWMHYTPSRIHICIFLRTVWMNAGRDLGWRQRGGGIKKAFFREQAEKRKRLRTEIKWRKKNQGGFTFVFSFLFYRDVNYEHYRQQTPPYLNHYKLNINIWCCCLWFFFL